MTDLDPSPERSSHTWELAGFGLMAVVFGASFGVVATANGLSSAKAMAMSAWVFGAGPQFGALGVALAGGAFAAVLATGVMLNARHAAFGLAVGVRMRMRGIRRAFAAVVMLDAPALLALREPDPSRVDAVYIRTGILVYGLWLAGTAVGVFAGSSVGDPDALGLDVALPAMFVSLLFSALQGRRTIVAALAGAGIAFALLPNAPAGVPVLAAVAGAAVPLVVFRSDPSAGSDEAP